MEKSERIAKIIARSGLCSRREAERWIADGRVQIDGEIIDTPALTVASSQVILVDGKPLSAPKLPALWLFHKPKGCLTTNDDPQGRQTVFDILPETLPRVMSIGRLDMNTEGLLLLTNDGGLARFMELPKHGWERCYRVRAYGGISDAALRKLRAGVPLKDDKGRTQIITPVRVEVEENAGNRNSWLMITVKEGKYREIKRLCEHVGLQVSRLIRVSFGPFELGSLKIAEVKQVQQNVLNKRLKVFFE